MKRTIAMLLCALLALSLCTGFAFAEGEQRVLTIGSAVNGKEFWNYDVMKKVQEELNMVIEHTYYNEDSYSAMLASGDMPDVVIGYGNLQMILDNKLAMNVEPYLEEYCPSVLSDSYRDYAELSKTMLTTEDGGFYIFMPTVGLHNYMGRTGQSQARGYVVQWEYYKELGCPEIKNDEDYLAVLKQMMDNHPTADDGTRTYMIGVMKAFEEICGFRASFLSDIAVNPWCPYMFKNNVFTNELVDGYMDVENSPYWHDMAFYNQVYRMGGFDPDTFTMTADEYYAKRDKNSYMGQWDRGGETYAVVPSTGTLAYTNLLLGMGNCPTYYCFVSANAKNWDLALQFFNYIYDIDFAREWYSGVQGKDWDYDENGVPALTEEAIAAKAANDPYWSATGNGYGQREWYLSGYNPAVMHTDGYPLDLAMADNVCATVQTTKEKDIAATYGVEHWYEAFVNAGVQDFRNNAGDAISAYISDIPKDTLRIIQTCNDILYSAVPDLIMAESDDEFDEIREETLAELRAVGEEEAWEWYSAEWEIPKEIFVAQLEEVMPAAGFELYPVD